MLVFLSGEREIRDTADALARQQAARHRGPAAVRPAVRAPSSTGSSHAAPRPPDRARHQRRRDLADRARHQVRHRPRHRPDLPLQPPDQGAAAADRADLAGVSANQRKGRCGRTSDGICIRLYAEEDFDARPEFTDPEILRTNLASVILQMTALGLGDIAGVPVRRPAGPRASQDGVDLLEELGALDPSEGPPQRLTPLGRKLAQLPVDPRLARMVLEADRNGCLREVHGHRRRAVHPGPAGAAGRTSRQAADEQHARFADQDSDFLAYLNLWNYLGSSRRSCRPAGSAGCARPSSCTTCGSASGRTSYGQLRQVAQGPRHRRSNGTPAGPTRSRCTRSLLAGLLSHIGLMDAEDAGRRTPRVPRRPRRPVRDLPRLGAVQEAAALGDGRRAGRDLPAVGPDRRRRSSRSGPSRWPGTWSSAATASRTGRRTRRAVMAYEKVTLYGVPIVAGRKVELRPDRPGAVPGAVHPPRAGRGRLGDPPQVLRRQPASCSTRSRSWSTGPGAATSSSTTRRCSTSTTSGSRPTSSPARHFDSLVEDRPGATTPDLLDLRPGDAGQRPARAVDPGRLPGRLAAGRAQRCALTYQFEPGTDADGVTVAHPAAGAQPGRAGRLRLAGPGAARGAGHRADPVAAQAAAAQLRAGAGRRPRRAVAARRRRQEPLLDALARELRRMTGVDGAAATLGPGQVPDAPARSPSGSMDERERRSPRARTWPRCKRRLAPEGAGDAVAGRRTSERTGLTTWTSARCRGGRATRAGRVKAYPALVDEGDSVAVPVFDDRGRAAARCGRAPAGCCC